MLRKVPYRVVTASFALLAIDCTPATPPRPASAWNTLPEFVEAAGGRSFRLVVEGRVPIPIRSVRIALDGTRFWAIEGDVTGRIEKPTEVGPGDHELALVIVMTGTGREAGYKLEVKSAHVVTDATSEVTVVLDWDPSGNGYQDHPKVHWIDGP